MDPDPSGTVPSRPSPEVFMPRRRSSSALVWPLAVALLLLAGAPPAAHAQATFNYGEALQKSIFFYEAQISGPKPP